MISRRLIFLAAVLLLFGCAGLSRAQDSSGTSSGSQSLGDAARKARAQKKDSAKPAKVFTNDDVGGLKGTISVVGNGSGPQSGAATDNAAGKTEDKKSSDAADEASWRAKFAGARKTLAADEKELDILQRELNLKQEQYSQDPNWAMHEQNSRGDINKTRDEIDAKKHAVEKDKEALANMEDELRKAGGKPSWADEPSSARPSESGDAGSGASDRSSSNSASANSDTTEPQR
jgi:hypothetical protein